MSEAMKTSAALIDKGLAALGRRLGSVKTDVQSLAVMITMHAVEHGDITKATTLCDIVRKNGLRADSLEKWFVTEGCASVEEKETEKGKKVKHFTVNKERRALIAHAVKVDGKAKVMGKMMKDKPWDAAKKAPAPFAGFDLEQRIRALVKQAESVKAKHADADKVKIDDGMLSDLKRLYLKAAPAGQIGPEVVVEGWTEADTACLN